CPGEAVGLPTRTLVGTGLAARTSAAAGLATLSVGFAAGAPFSLTVGIRLPAFSLRRACSSRRIGHGILLLAHRPRAGRHPHIGAARARRVRIFRAPRRTGTAPLGFCLQASESFFPRFLAAAFALLQWPFLDHRSLFPAPLRRGLCLGHSLRLATHR